MKLREGVVLNEMDGKILAVDAGDGSRRFEGMLRMNQTAGFVASLLEKDTDLEGIVKAMTEKYEVSEDCARENAQKVIEAFKKADLLED